MPEDDLFITVLEMIFGLGHMSLLAVALVTSPRRQALAIARLVYRLRPSSPISSYKIQTTPK